MMAKAKSQKSHALLPKSGCQYTFVDGGSNSGDTVNAFVHAEHHSTRSINVTNGSLWGWNAENPLTEDFDYHPLKSACREILKETNSHPAEYCVIGLEANDGWKENYRKFTEGNSQYVSHLGMHSGVALGIEDGPMDFQCAHVDPENFIWGAGQPDETLSRSNQYKCTVQARSLPSIFQEMHGRSAKVVVLRMDVESMINKIVPPFLESGSLEALSAEGVHTYLLVDSMHMNKEVLKAWSSHKTIPNVTWTALTVTSGAGGVSRDI
jgi:hypothetical protein